MSSSSIDRSVGGISGIFQEAGSGLMRVAGGFGNFPGPSIFMIRSVISGTTSAVILGLAGAAFSATIVGTASIPFLVCSCAGFIFGSVAWYRNTLQRSIISLRRHPTLMKLHMDANFPDRDFLRYQSTHLQEAVGRSWILQSMLVCAWLTAQPALEDMLESRQQAITSSAEADQTDDGSPAQ